MRPLLETNGIQKTYGRQTVLNNLSFVISEEAHIALIGRNGSGKTTLLRILSGEEEADAGTIRLMPWTKLGILRQNDVLPSDQPTLAYLSQDSRKPEWECAKLASRFGLRGDDLKKAPATLSGGYQMRVKIVRMLLDQPNLLLLDEPVNYLDLPTLLLLEAFLKDYRGAFVMTSHDREVLQNVGTSTWEIHHNKMTLFPGDVETYLDWKEEQVQFAKRTNKRLRREIASAQQFADRFRFKASLATRAQSKLKHITKLRTHLRELDGVLPTAAFRIPCPVVIPGSALRCQDLTIGYGEIPIAREINFEIPRGAKVAIVGENGRGKSTLLKTLAGSLPTLSGSYKWWHKADIGYFSQLSEDTLSENETVLEALTRAAPAQASGERILAAAGAFLFKEDDLEKPCGVLSGGERGRIRLARLILQEHSVLLLDEPTNHLDAETVEVLARALKEYTGTVIVISHARTFMNALVDRIYEVRNGTLRQYMGSYEDYVTDLPSIAEETAHEPIDTSVSEDAHAKREETLLAKERRRLQQRLEEKIAALDKEKSKILAYFFENPTDYAPEKARRLSELNEEMEQVENEWLNMISPLL